MKHYLSCLLFSLLTFLLSVKIFPMIPIPSYINPVIIWICGIVLYIIGPIPSTYRPLITKNTWNRFRIKTSIMVSIYFLFSILFSHYPYLDIIVWTIVVQTIQIIITNILQKGERYEQSTEI